MQLVSEITHPTFDFNKDLTNCLVQYWQMFSGFSPCDNKYLLKSCNHNTGYATPWTSFPIIFPSFVSRVISMSTFTASMQIVTELSSGQKRKKNTSPTLKRLGTKWETKGYDADYLDRRSSLFFHNKYCHNFGS